MKKPQQQVVPVLGGALDITVNVAGEGAPLLYLHSAGGYYWDDFLDALAERYRVYVPHFPGTAPGRPNDIDRIDGLWDAVIAYEDLLDGLGLERFRLMGHSFGGMLAAELAAQRPRAVQHLVLIAPIGLWRADAPYTCADWCALTFDEIMQTLFHDRQHPRVLRRMTPPEGKDAEALWTVEFVWTLGCTGKVIWPIPDKGLRKRIHRVVAPTLVAWGADDRLIPPVYAEEFRRALPDAEVALLPQCGHEPPLEQCELLLSRVIDFFGA
jgi:pimeloyl-ACP methyl ester carboxylesterase